MSARSSSTVPGGLGRLTKAHAAKAAEHTHLLDRLATVPEPRTAKGRRHPLRFVPALAACAVLAGAKSLTAIAECAADAPSAEAVPSVPPHPAGTGTAAATLRPHWCCPGRGGTARSDSVPPSH
ncbi:transposase family protein [Streptomyces sp. NPDC056628]|uniref:transposase family protein n=1 Tax=Streptomyces sp. NPDC056628 TaxID=3345882 RepID=UPI0036870938